MKRFSLLLLLVTFRASASENYAINEGPEVALAAYSRAVNQAPLTAADENAVRVWSRDYMRGQVDGFVFSGSTSLLCHMSSSYVDGIVTLGRATCRRVRSRATAAQALRQLPRFSRSEWDCPLMDGGEIFIERVQEGEISAARIGNPEACSDPESKAAAEALRKLW